MGRAVEPALAIFAFVADHQTVLALVARSVNRTRPCLFSKSLQLKNRPAYLLKVGACLLEVVDLFSGAVQLACGQADKLTLVGYMPAVAGDPLAAIHL